MNLTAREWIELIADPEKKNRVMGWVEKYPDSPDKKYSNVVMAVLHAIDFDKAPKEAYDLWRGFYETPPALLPIPNKEREAAEAVLKGFAEMFNYQQPHKDYEIKKEMITNFLNQKYPTNG